MHLKKYRTLLCESTIKVVSPGLRACHPTSNQLYGESTIKNLCLPVASRLCHLCEPQVDSQFLKVEIPLYNLASVHREKWVDSSTLTTDSKGDFYELNGRGHFDIYQEKELLLTVRQGLRGCGQRVGPDQNLCGEKHRANRMWQFFDPIGYVWYL